MLRKTLLFLMIAVSVTLAQTAEPELHVWKHSMVTGLNISQISLNNWAKGGQNSLNWTLTLDYSGKFNWEKWKFKNDLKAAYGRSKLGEDEYRTNDNELYNESVLSMLAGWNVDPYISNTIRTQISTGFDYKASPAVEIADFFDPGYVTQSIGFTYDQLHGFTTRLGVAFQETFTNVHRNYSDDPETLTEAEAFKFETGLESVTDGEVTLDENIIYKSKLRLFTRFENIDVWDVYFDNLFSAKVNSWLNVNLTIQLIYEKSQSPKTQLKQALQLGLRYTLI